MKLLKNIKLNFITSYLYKAFNFFRNKFFLSFDAFLLKQHNKNIWSKWRAINTDSLILLDPFYTPEWILSSIYFSNILAKKFNSKICTFSKGFSFDPLCFRSSYNVNKNILISLNKSQRVEREALFLYFINNVLTKNQLFNFKIKNIWIGIDIYETYLRTERATINFDDNTFRNLVKEGITNFIFWRDFLNSFTVKALVISHDCYINCNILAKLAYSKKIPVFLPNARGLNRSYSPFSIYKDRFYNFPNEFSKLSIASQKKARLWSKNKLNQRFEGVVGVDMRYSMASAFNKKKINSNSLVFLKSSKIKVLIATHCFYDNPHSYGPIIFPDFYEWLKFLVNVSSKTDYDWYIKPHPDYLPGTIETINKIIGLSSNIKLVPPNTSFHQMIEEGLEFVLTGFGSVGHELPLLGVKVINCGFNPHIAYNFNFHARNKTEYRSLIFNLPRLNMNINKTQIYEFYYMYKWASFVDNLIFNSYYKMTKDLSYKEQFSPKIFKYFLQEFNLKKHAKIIEHMTNFIESKEVTYISHPKFINERN